MRQIAEIFNPVNDSNSNNFPKYNSRFSGKNIEIVVAFIDTILVYKDDVNISNENYRNGLSMFLDGQAAVRWQHAKANTQTRNAVLAVLRHAYRKNKLEPNIFKDCF